MVGHLGFRIFDRFVDNPLFVVRLPMKRQCPCTFFRGPMVLEADKDCLIGLLPFYHIYGMVVVQFNCLVQGAKMVVVPKFEPEKFLHAIQEHKVKLFETALDFLSTYGLL